MAKKGDPGPLSRMCELIQWLDEDVESLGWVIVTDQPTSHVAVCGRTEFAVL